MKRWSFTCAAMTIFLLLGWLSWDGWAYLQRGYSLKISFSGKSSSIYHVDFPEWRIFAYALLWVTGMITVSAYIIGQRWTPAAAWLVFGVTLVIGIYDVVEYGTIGSPTSVWSVLVLFAFALLARVDPFTPNVDF